MSPPPPLTTGCGRTGRGRDRDALSMSPCNTSEGYIRSLAPRHAATPPAWPAGSHVAALVEVRASERIPAAGQLHAIHGNSARNGCHSRCGSPQAGSQHPDTDDDQAGFEKEGEGADP